MLEKQVVSLSPSGGLETKVDEKLVQNEKALILENAVFEKIGALKKCFGYDRMSSTIDSNSRDAIASQLPFTFDKVMAFKQLPFTYNNFKALSYSQTSGKWNDTSAGSSLAEESLAIKTDGPVNGFTSVGQQILRDIPRDPTQKDSAIGPISWCVSGDYLFYAHADGYTSGDYKITRVDLNNNNSITIQSPLVDGGFKLLAVVDTVVRIHAYSSTGVVVLDTNLNVISSVALNADLKEFLDAIVSPDGKSSCALYSVATSDNLKISKVNVGASIVQTTTITYSGVTPSSETLKASICFAYGSNDDISCIYTEGVDSTHVKITKRKISTDTELIATTTIGTHFGVNLFNITYIRLNLANGLSGSAEKYMLVQMNAEIDDPNYKKTYWGVNTCPLTASVNVIKDSTSSFIDVTYDRKPLENAIFIGRGFNSQYDNSGMIEFIPMMNLSLNDQLQNCVVVMNVSVDKINFNSTVYGWFRISVANRSEKDFTLTYVNYGDSRRTPMSFSMPTWTDSSGKVYSFFVKAIDLIQEVRLLRTKIVKYLVFDPNKKIKATYFGQNAICNISNQQCFDGVNQVENNFNFWPDNLQGKDSTGASSNGGVPVGDSIYHVVFTYKDRAGNLIQSAPSSTITVTNAATPTPPNYRINTILVPIPPFTSMDYRQVNACLYRSINGVFYFVTAVSANLGILYLTLTDDYSDANINSNKILYTNGGILPNDMMPQHNIHCIGASRMFVAQIENENTVSYSKKYLVNDGLNFSDFFTIDVQGGSPGEKGGITGLGYMDNKLIIFKKNSIFYVTGDGPLETGLNNTFSDPVFVPSDVGCSDHASVISTKLGIIFKSLKGFYLLDRGLNTTYIGSPVAAYDSQEIFSTIMMDDKHQVRFILSDKVLLYDYLKEAWSVLTNLGGTSSDIYNLKQIFFKTSNVCLENSSFTANGSFYSMRFKTPWLKLTGVQAFARLWRVLVLGAYKSGHTLNVKMYFNYDVSIFETHTITPTSDPYQFKFHVANQKLETVQFEIWDSNQSGTGESMELSNLTMECGVKKSAFKLKTSAQA